MRALEHTKNFEQLVAKIMRHPGMVAISTELLSAHLHIL